MTVNAGLPRGKPLIMCASFEDMKACKGSDIVLLGHGVGQTYNGDVNSTGHPSYSGGRGRERVRLFLCSSERDATNCRVDGAMAVAIGCPKMDGWHNGSKQKRESGDKPVVVISHHADIFVCAESRSAFAHYRQAYIELARQVDDLPFRILAHGHPRWTHYLKRFWERIGVEFVEDFDEVLERADCYVIDNSSTGPEFCSTGRPVVILDAPWYRVDVHHGGRFWDWADMGVRIQEPHQLLPAIGLALSDPPPLRERRERIVQDVYGGLTDGKATQRAVEAICQLTNG